MNKAPQEKVKFNKKSENEVVIYEAICNFSQSLLRQSDPAQTILGYKYDNKCNFLCLLLSEESKV